MDFYSAVKKNKIMKYPDKCIESKKKKKTETVLSEVSQSLNNKHCRSSPIWET